MRLQQWILVSSVVRIILFMLVSIYDAIEFGVQPWQEGVKGLQWPNPIPSRSDPIDKTISLAFYHHNTVGWPHDLHGHLASHWGLAMATFLHHWHPHQLFQSVSWTSAIVWSLWEYTYSQWKECNSHIHGVNLKASRTIDQQSMQEQITTGYHNLSSIPNDKQSSTFSIPHTTSLLQPFSLSQQCLAHAIPGLTTQVFKQTRSRSFQPCMSTIFLISQTT